MTIWDLLAYRKFELVHPVGLHRASNSLRWQGKRLESLAAYNSAAEVYKPSNVGIDSDPSLARELQEHGLPKLTSLILQKNFAFKRNDLYSIVELG